MSVTPIPHLVSTPARNAGKILRKLSVMRRMSEGTGVDAKACIWDTIYARIRK